MADKKNYSNIAVNTTLASGIDASQTSFVVAEATGWPAAPFVAVIEPGTASEEVVLIGGKSGTTFSSVTRGYNGTTPSTHGSLSVVKHAAIADDYTSIWEHVHDGSNADQQSHDDLADVSGDDHHSQSHGHDGLDSSGQVAHTNLTTVGEDDHHAKAHAHDGADGSGSVSHDDLTDIASGDHHTRYADAEADARIAAADLTDVGDVATGQSDGDVLAWDDVAGAWEPVAGSGVGVGDHDSLTGVSDNDHHAKSHAHDGADGSGTVAHDDLTGSGADDHHNENHASRHIRGGADEIDGDQIDIDWNPSTYTPATNPAQVSSVDHLTAHLYGIDQSLAAAGGLTEAYLKQNLPGLMVANNVFNTTPSLSDGSYSDVISETFTLPYSGQSVLILLMGFARVSNLAENDELWWNLFINDTGRLDADDVYMHNPNIGGHSHGDGSYEASGVPVTGTSAVAGTAPESKLVTSTHTLYYALTPMSGSTLTVGIRAKGESYSGSGSFFRLSVLAFRQWS